MQTLFGTFEFVSWQFFEPLWVFLSTRNIVIIFYSRFYFYFGIISKFKIKNLRLCRCEASSFVTYLSVTISQIHREMTCVFSSLTLLRECTRYGGFVKVVIVLWNHKKIQISDGCRKFYLSFRFMKLLSEWGYPCEVLCCNGALTCL
jgi:hypothetical protein